MLKQKQPTTYDAIVVLGSSFDERGNLPEHLLKRLKLVAELHKQGVAPYIIVCGKHSIQWDWADIDVDVRECDLMQEELIRLGVSSTRIQREHWSKDTIGNFYYLKTKLLIPHQMNRILVACATHHLARSKFLSQKILGPGYHVDFQTSYSPATHNPIAMRREHQIIREQKQFLALMEDGDHHWFKPNMYDHPYYLKQQKEPHHRKIPQMLAHMGV